MSISHLHIARLDAARLAQLRAAEDELELAMAALEPPPELANLSEVQLQRIQALESELGLILLAYTRD